jgi:lysophospholipase L1-like esterase
MTRCLSRERGELVGRVALLMALAASGCGTPAAPTPPPPPTDPPTISCPVSVSAISLDGNAVAVTFPAPTVIAGAPPVTTTCTHQSGAPFGVGTTNVACTARDAQQRAASCGFTVTVTVPPRLNLTRFLAFGDSITAGVSALCNRGVIPQDVFFFVPPDGSYPGKLQALLSERYFAQTPDVTQAGRGGEGVLQGVTPPAGVDRLPVVLSQSAPQVLMLQEGVNDLHALLSPATVVGGLRTMIREARGRGVQVLIGTLLPQRAGGCRAFAPSSIAPTNDLIRAMVLSETGVTLVDLWSAFGGVPGTLIGEDGLHPSDAGYARIAEAFMTVIRARFEGPTGN